MSAEPIRRCWTREEYYRAAELGIFRPDERLELIDGEIIAKVSPQGTPHATAIRATASELERLFGAGVDVRSQMPMTLSNRSEPEPDVLVVAGSYRNYENHHPIPSDVVLLVEVSDSTLGFDRGRKAALYAKAGITDYWVLNLNARQLEIRRNPTPEGVYADVSILSEEEAASPLAAPEKSVRITDLLPSREGSQGAATNSSPAVDSTESEVEE